LIKGKEVSKIAEENGGKTQLYIGESAEEQEKGSFSHFDGFNKIPITWYLMFSPEDIVSRQEVNPNSVQTFQADQRHSRDPLEELSKYLDEPVHLITSLDMAKERLNRYKEVFEKIPYLWSYFRVINILNQQLDEYIEKLENLDPVDKVERLPPHPDGPRSQVQVTTEQETTDMEEGSGDLDELLTYFADESSSPEPVSIDPDPVDSSEEGLLDAMSVLAGLESSEPVEDKQESISGDMYDDLLLSELEIMSEIDLQAGERAEEELRMEAIEARRSIVIPVTVNFEDIAVNLFGYQVKFIIERFEDLYHHARREGTLTRVMQDITQEIFTKAQSGWRITGLLAEDFVQGDPSKLANIMLGSPSPMIILDEIFDLEYWTKESLQSGDERLMYTLSMVPTEMIHRAIEVGKLEDIIPELGSLMLTTRGMDHVRLSDSILKEKPTDSNIWGFRVLLPHKNKQYIAATLLCADPETSWEADFKSRLNLPGVLEDWNIDYEVRFSQFNDTDNYNIVFKRAKDIEDTFESFGRWIRRHNMMYKQQFGVVGTIQKLKSLLINTMDKNEGQLLFTILTNITAAGFTAATDALAEEAVVEKLSWLFS
jgi:hypothetical protein